eukprot:4086488-Prymnesium_polylepis.1
MGSNGAKWQLEEEPPNYRQLEVDHPNMVANLYHLAFSCGLSAKRPPRGVKPNSSEWVAYTDRQVRLYAKPKVQTKLKCQKSNSKHDTPCVTTPASLSCNLTNRGALVCAPSDFACNRTEKVLP